MFNRTLGVLAVVVFFVAHSAYASQGVDAPSHASEARSGRVDSEARRLERKQQRTAARLAERQEARRIKRETEAVRLASFAVAADPVDSLALVALYNSAGGANWVNNDGWLQGDVSSWHGVTLDAGGRVVELLLSRNNLVGTLPAELGDLTALQLFEVADNGLGGSLPAEIGDMVDLVALVAWGNQLSGTLPAELGNLTQLLELQLFDNALSGDIPASLGNLKNLELLYLDQNFLSGPIPAELGNLAFLVELFLDFNFLSGTIPTELGNLSNLTALFLGDNELTGGIPASLGQLRNLRLLWLSNNPLGGAIPSDLYTLNGLTTLGLGGLGLTGSLGQEFSAFSQLTILDLSDNAYNNIIPFQFGFGLLNLKELDLSGNDFSGAIPQSLVGLGVLNYLDLSFNRLTAVIPNEISFANRLTHLYLNNNELNGPLPFGMGELVRLQELDLSNNFLTGEIPRWIGNPAFIKVIVLNSNLFSGELPIELNKLGDLEVLDFWNNELSGPFPEALTEMASLRFVDIGNNAFEGLLPATISNMAAVEDFFLDGNAFSGPIPPEIGGLLSVNRLYLSENDFSGDAPAELDNLQNLSVLRLQGNDLSGLPAFDWAFRPDSLIVSNNALTFEDLEPNLDAAFQVRYIPQAEVPTYWTRANNNVQLSVDVGGTANAYQWYQAGAAISGAGTSVYTLTGPAVPDTVHAQVTSSLVPGLVIQSRSVRSDAELAIISVSPDTAMVIEGGDVQFKAESEDQFGNFLSVKPQWMAEGGTIDTRGIYTAGEVPGTYLVTARGPDGLVADSAWVEIFKADGTSTTPAPHPADGSVQLYPGFPNPFRVSTTLRFELPRSGSVYVAVYDVLGRLKAVLVDQHLPAGRHEAAFFAESYPPGLYLVRLVANDQAVTQTLIHTR